MKIEINQQEIDESETKNFEWAANLVSEMDWNSTHYHNREHQELCVIATRLRPNFYETLRRLRVPFDAEFSEGIYEILKSSGKKIQLKIEEFEQAYQLVQLMARDNLTELQCSYDLMGNI